MIESGEICRTKVREIVESFPDGHAELVLGLHLKLTVRGKRFGWFMEDHHGNGRLEINCKALPGVALSLTQENPTVYHIPSYQGKLGYAGIWLDVPGVNWDEVRELLYQAYLMSAPKSLLKTLPK